MNPKWPASSLGETGIRVRESGGTIVIPSCHLVANIGNAVYFLDRNDLIND
uniref:Uncharacterized protein n=1 Tax=Anguilla anguilla TaxID=7936 RepID=A0A0E9WGL2_ANGAN